MDLIHTYRMFQKMMRYSKHVDEMRGIFLKALEERGVITKEEIEREANRALAQQKITEDNQDFKEYINVLIDIYFANNFTDQEIENHINLARKLDRSRTLSRVVNREGATAIMIKRALKEFCEIPEGDLYIPRNEAMGTRVALIHHFISNQLPFVTIAKNHITIRDIDEMVDQSYWSKRRPGRVGGKAAGMLLAYKIIMPRLEKRDAELEKYVTIPESYYFNSGLFSDFIDYNGFHDFHHQKYKTRDVIEDEYKTMARLFQGASFPPDVEQMFAEFLEKVGEAPLILRSSSLLEDNFGYAFSGKYDSVFVANQGPPDKRLKEFMWGLKQVHMSTFGPAPILYRRQHKLLDFDEKMGILVQKVSGRRHGDYFFPFAAGVAYSFNSYAWTPRIKKEDGLVRMVFGLGTRAVDRVASDYPRMIALSHPTLRPEGGANEIVKYSQKMVDVLNLKKGSLETIPFQDLAGEVGHPDLHNAVSVRRDGQMTSPMFKKDKIDIDRSSITFENFLSKTPFVRVMKKILSKLEKAYGRPVDIEFAWDGNRLYLLQCRTLALREDGGIIEIPQDIPQERILFTNNRGVSNAVVRDIEYIVYVDPRAYGRLETVEEKTAIGKVVSRLNRALGEKRYALFGPGRWGSNDINLGVRVGYEDLNRTRILGEIAFEERGSTPEVSYGTHFFNDLVEAQIVPIALYPDESGTLFKETCLLDSNNELNKILPEMAPYAPVVHVMHVPSCYGGMMLHVYQDGRNQEGVGFIAPPSEKSENGLALG